MKTVAIYDECYNINTENNIRSFHKLPTILLTDETLKELSPEAKLLYTILYAFSTVLFGELPIV